MKNENILLYSTFRSASEIIFETSFVCFYTKMRPRFFTIITVRKRTLGPGKFFTGVCQLFCSQGGGTPDRDPPLDRDPPRTETPPWTETPLEREPMDREPKAPAPDRDPPPPVC